MAAGHATAPDGPSGFQLSLYLNYFFAALLGVAFFLRLPTICSWLINGGLIRSSFFRRGSVDRTNAPLPTYALYRVAGRKPKPSGFLRAIAPVRPLAHTPLPGVSITLAQAFILAVSLAASVVVLAWGNINQLDSPRRSGWISVALCPAIVGLGLKNSIVGAMGGWGYEKLNTLHRLLGRLSFIFSLIHTIGFLNMWIKSNTIMKKLLYPSNQAAVIAEFGILLTAALSIPFFRRHAYSLFWYSHLVGFWMFLVAVCYHVPSVNWFIIPCIVAYSLDLVLRAARTRIATAHIRPHSQAGYTTLTIPSIRGGWEPGQHLYLRVHGLGGILGGAVIEKHPITIASAAGGEDGLRLVVKSAGDWTGRLIELAETRKGASRGEKTSFAATTRVWVEGPYGGPMYTSFGTSTSVLLLAAGSGLSFALSCAEDLIRLSKRNKCRTEMLEIVWVVRDVATFEVFEDELNDLLVEAETSPIELHFSVYITRPPSRGPNLSDLLPHKYAHFYSQRPSIAAIIEGVVTSARKEGCPHGVSVGVCGPAPVVRSVRAAVGGLDTGLMKDVGGVHIHSEMFSW